MRSCKRAGSSVSRPRLCAFVAEDLRLLSPKPEADAPDRSWAWLQSLLPAHHGVLLRAWRAPRSILRQEKRATVCCSCGASVLKEAVMVAARPSARAGVKHACQIAVEADGTEVGGTLCGHAELPQASLRVASSCEVQPGERTPEDNVRPLEASTSTTGWAR